MSVSEKIGKFSDEQLADWMRSNPGGAAKAFEIWRGENPSGVSTEPRVVYRDKVVFRDKVVEKPVERVVIKERPVEKVVFRDKVIEKVVEVRRGSSVNKILMVLTGVSLVVSGFVGYAKVPEVIERVVEGPERVIQLPGERIYGTMRGKTDEDFTQLSKENSRLREKLDTQADTIRFYMGL